MLVTVVLCFVQAVYRGHFLRRKLQEVRERAHHISDDDASFEEDINMDYVDEVGQDQSECEPLYIALIVTDTLVIVKMYVPCTYT